MQVTKTTTHLSLPRAADWRDRLVVPALIIAALVFVAAAGITTVSRLRSAPAIAAQPTPGLVILIATARAEQLPTPAAVAQVVNGGHTLARAVVAYDAPAGKVIGAIDSGHRYQIVARFGVDWLQADVTGSGVVWLMTADVFDLPQGLADLAPSATPQIVTVMSAPQTVYVAAPVPAEPHYTVTNAQLQPTTSTLGEPTAEAAYRQQIGLTDDERAQALAAHVAREIAFCAANPQNASCIANPPSEEQP